MAEIEGWFELADKEECGKLSSVKIAAFTFSYLFGVFDAIDHVVQK